MKKEALFKAGFDNKDRENIEKLVQELSPWTKEEKTKIKNMFAQFEEDRVPPLFYRLYLRWIYEQRKSDSEKGEKNDKPQSGLPYKD